MKKYSRSTAYFGFGALALFGIQMMSEAAHQVVSGAASHFGEKLADLVLLPASAPELALGKEFSVKLPGCDFHMARVATGTTLELVPSLITTPERP